MSGGYTPLFSSLTTGTLCGKWPDIGLWPIVLSLADKNGIVDVTHEYISMVTGLALPEVVACMSRFCQSDYGSRSPAEAGARLMLLEEHREWGWQIVNHAMYRERARLQAKAAREVESGQNKSRMAERHHETAGDRRSPPETAADPLSNANANANAVEEQPRGKRSVAARGSRIPIPYEPSEEVRQWAKSKTPDVDVTAAAAEFADFWKGVPGQRGCKLDWEATFRNRLRELQGRVRQTRRSGPEDRGNGLKFANP